MDSDTRYMQLALAEANKALAMGEVPVGCVIVADGQVVGRGHNLTETLADVTAHAEMQAITAATNTLGGKYLSQCTLYVTIEPCVMCAGAMIQSRIRKCYYGAKNDRFGVHLGPINLFEVSFNHKVEIDGGIMKEECSKLISDFFKNLRNNKDS